MWENSIFSLFEELSPRLVKGKKDPSKKNLYQQPLSYSFDLGTCYSHVLHNSVKHGNKHLLFDVETALLKIYSHFCRSSVRARELKNYLDFVEQEQKVTTDVLILDIASIHTFNLGNFETY